MMSLLFLDFIMSLSPHWYSTIMGMHFFTACFYCGLAVIIIMAVFGKSHLFPDDFMTTSDFHDIGKLTFGFAICWMSACYASISAPHRPASPATEPAASRLQSLHKPLRPECRTLLLRLHPLVPHRLWQYCACTCWIPPANARRLSNTTSATIW